MNLDKQMNFNKTTTNFFLDQLPSDTQNPAQISVFFLQPVGNNRGTPNNEILKLLKNAHTKFACNKNKQKVLTSRSNPTTY